MRKITLLTIVLIGIALSYACNKNNKVQTQISGTLITNGTSDPLQLSTELSNPEVVLFHVEFASGGVVAGEDVATEIARTTVDDNAGFSFDLELYEQDEYFIGFIGLDETKYYTHDVSWWDGDMDYYPVTPGSSNIIRPEALAISWVRPRFINTNPDPNNQDVFRYIAGMDCDNCIPGNTPPVLSGDTDTLLYWIGETWSGQTQYGGANQMKHEVEAKLTRKGITRDTVIPYFVPPFDTTIVEIRY